MSKPPESALPLLESRYFQPGEDWERLCRRVASAAARAEPEEQRERWERSFFDAMFQTQVLPNTPALINAGTDRKGSVSACFVQQPQDSMESIMDVATTAAMTLKFGGGVGFELSLLRPAGAAVNSTHKYAMGPLGVLSLYNKVGDTVTQAGVRKAALMAVLRIDHPDVFKFIHAKEKDGDLANFNISVSVPDSFMKRLAKEPDKPHLCAFGGRQYHILPNGEPILKAERGSREVLSVEDIWGAVCEHASTNGDPGILFVDAINRDNVLISGLSDTENPQYIHGVNPCLAGSTLLLTKQGLRTIRDLAQPVASVTGPFSGQTHEVWTGELWAQATVFRSGIDVDTVQVRTSSGLSVVCTPDHKFWATNPDNTEGWVEARHLEGCKIEPCRGTALPEESGEDMEGVELAGYIQGDGTYHEASGRYKYVSIDAKDQDVLELSRSLGHHWLPTSKSWSYSLPYEYGLELNEVLEHKALPSRGISKLVGKSQAYLKRFLRGLYSANGSVLVGAQRITLKSTCLQMVEDVQRILLSMGISPYITTNHPSDVEFANGTYTCKESYDLNIARAEDQEWFARNIGFIQEYKTQALQSILQRAHGRPRKVEVVEVRPAGQQDVYDFSITIPGSTHQGWANGFLVHNCGEQGLPHNGACILGSVDLAKFVTDVGLDTDALQGAFELTTRLLDDLIDSCGWPTQGIADQVVATRRIGVGVMGFASMLDKLGIRYASEECMKMIDLVGSLREAACTKMSRQLAEERGPYPLAKAGDRRRNAGLTTVAPTGSLAMLAGTSWSIEPHTYWVFTERRNDVERLRYLPVVEDMVRSEELRELEDSANGDLEKLNAEIQKKLPWHMTLSRDLTPEDHMSVVAAWQKFTDSGVSKTVVLPPDVLTPEKVSQIYRWSWENKIKGITVYPEGSREGEPMSIKKNGKKQKWIHLPDELDAKRVKVEFELNGRQQKAFVIVGMHPEHPEQPVEVFLKHPHEDDLVAVQFIDLTTRLISMGLRYRHCQHCGKETLPLGQIIKQLDEADGQSMYSVPKIFKEVLAKFIEPDEPVGVCKECGGNLVITGRCISCVSCGWSKCG